MPITCSPLTGRFFDTCIVASTDKGWYYRSIKMYVSAGNYWKLLRATLKEGTFFNSNSQKTNWLWQFVTANFCHIVKSSKTFLFSNLLSLKSVHKSQRKVHNPCIFIHSLM